MRYSFTIPEAVMAELNAAIFSLEDHEGAAYLYPFDELRRGGESERDRRRRPTVAEAVRQWVDGGLTVGANCPVVACR